MDRIQWLGEFKSAMQNAGVGKKYISDCCGELSDHWDDIEKELGMEASEAVYRVGCPVEAAEQVASSYSRMNWVGRHPILSFVVAPIPVLIVTFCVYALGFYAVVISSADSIPFLVVKWLWMVTGTFPSVLMLSLSKSWVSSRRSVMWLGAAAALSLLFAIIFSPFAHMAESGERMVGYGMNPSWLRPMLWIPIAIPLIAVVIRQKSESSAIGAV
jgi:hypothetical protein